MNFNCPKCGENYNEYTKFCINCGFNMENEFIEKPTCPKCKTEYSTGTKFCKKDGSRLVKPKDLVPRCKICDRQYYDNEKFCPIDGGVVGIKMSHTNKGNDFKSHKMFNNPFSFKGRIRRLEYGLTVLIYAVFSTILQLIVENSYGEANFLIISVIPAIWFLSAQGAKRCHDLGNTGWMQLIPFYGFWLIFQDGERGINRFGENPKN